MSVLKYSQQQQHSYICDDIRIEEQTKLSGHSWNISALSFNNTGFCLASGSWDKTVNIWDLKTLEEPKTLYEGHEQPVTCISWLPLVQDLLISGSADRSLIVWKCDTEEIIAKLVEHDAWVLSLSTSSDGLKFASSSWSGDVILWDTNTLKPLIQLNGQSTGIWTCAFNHSNENVLCTGSEDTSLRLWDFRVDQKLHSDIRLSGVHNDAVKCCCWSPCGNYVAAGSRDAKISLWDIRMKKAINCLFGHRSDVCGLVYMSNSSSLLFSVGDSHCCLWNTFNAQGECICSLQQHDWSYEVESLALSPDSTLLATGSVDEKICLSTVEVTHEYLNSLHCEDLAIARLPIKATSSSPLPIPDNINEMSTAEILDNAKTLQLHKEKELNDKISKQTVRIKAPVTSQHLSDHISNLRNVNLEAKHEIIPEDVTGLN